MKDFYDKQAIGRLPSNRELTPAEKFRMEGLKKANKSYSYIANEMNITMSKVYEVLGRRTPEETKEMRRISAANARAKKMRMANIVNELKYDEQKEEEPIMENTNMNDADAISDAISTLAHLFVAGVEEGSAEANDPNRAPDILDKLFADPEVNGYLGDIVINIGKIIVRLGELVKTPDCGNGEEVIA